jgi:hypothetical protein
MVLLVTLYQRLPTSDTLPRDLHPVFFGLDRLGRKFGWLKING